MKRPFQDTSDLFSIKCHIFLVASILVSAVSDFLRDLKVKSSGSFGRAYL